MYDFHVPHVFPIVLYSSPVVDCLATNLSWPGSWSHQRSFHWSERGNEMLGATANPRNITSSRYMLLIYISGIKQCINQRDPKGENASNFTSFLLNQWFTLPETNIGK